MAHYLDGFLQGLKNTLEANQLVFQDWVEEAKYKKAAFERADKICEKLADGLRLTEAAIRETEEQISKGAQ